MYFIEKIKDIIQDKHTKVFVDMDGVIADYNFNHKLDFKTKRPLFTNINTLKELSLIPNVQLFILSICRFEKEIEDKNKWLDKYAPFFIKDNRIIISKDVNKIYSSKEIKLNYLKEIIDSSCNDIVVLIDDDNDILKYLNENLSNKILLFQDSSIID